MRQVPKIKKTIEAIWAANQQCVLVIETMCIEKTTIKWGDDWSGCSAKIV